MGSPFQLKQSDLLIARELVKGITTETQPSGALSQGPGRLRQVPCDPTHLLEAVNEVRKQEFRRLGEAMRGILEVSQSATLTRCPPFLCDFSYWTIFPIIIGKGGDALWFHKPKSRRLVPSLAGVWKSPFCFVTSYIKWGIRHE